MDSQADKTHSVYECPSILIFLNLIAMPCILAEQNGLLLGLCYALPR